MTMAREVNGMARAGHRAESAGISGEKEWMVMTLGAGLALGDNGSASELSPSSQSTD